jgi:iron complex outermembrane receptor protein
VTIYHQTARPFLATLLTGSALALAPAVHAQQTDKPPEDDYHDRRVADFGEIIVSAQGVEQLDVLSGVSVVEGTQLQRDMAGQIGEVLAKLPGVSATSFSPGASRPVLRGFSGERVKVLVDGIGAIDVSNTSADHAVTIDPLTAERIEVLRGPAVMLYGSQAIGGAVNIIDKRIPRRQPGEAVHVDALAGVNTAGNLREGGASVDLPVGKHFVVHADGSWRKTDDLDIAGFAVAPELRAELLEEADEDEASEPEEAAELREAALQRGTLPNSATETWSANVGASMFANGSNLGISLGIYDTTYGVPGRPGVGHAHGEEEHEGEDHEEEGHEEEGEAPVTIAMRQYRADLLGELDLGEGFLSELKTRVGISDYTHTEFEGDEVGTVFDVQGIEARAEFVQADRNGWRGSFGAQYYFRDFAAEGAEAFIAPNRTDQFALFALQEFDAGPIDFELAGRFETTDVSSRTLSIDRSFNTVSGAFGIAHETQGGLRFGVNASRAERAPSAEELYSNGPHIATQAFEIGDPTLTTEGAWGLEGFVRGQIGPAKLNLAMFKSWFDDYIYLNETGLEEDGLPVLQYLQGDADYFGIEGEISVPLHTSDALTVLADVRGDYIRASLADGTPLPRIPPLSLLGALEAQTRLFDGRVEVQWFDRQDRLAPEETPTDGFTMVNASLAWKPLRGNANVTMLFKVENIFDVTGRRHASFTKDFVPMAGRNFSVSLRASL